MSGGRWLGPGLLLLVAVMWSFSGVLIKGIDMNPMAIAGLRSAFALPVVLYFAGLPRKRYSAVQWGGALGYVFTMVLFVAATRMTTAANATFLQYTAPIYVALLAPWMLGERARRIDIFVIAIALGGIALFFVDQLSPRGFWGNILGLGSGVAFALMTLVLRKERSAEPMQVIVLGNALTAVFGLPMLLHTGLPSASAWVPLILLGTIQVGLAYVLYTVAMRRMTALGATLITMLEPILNPLWVMLAIGERPSPWAVLGGALVLGAVLVRAAVSGRRVG